MFLPISARGVVATAAVLLFLAPGAPQAHEIPSDVKVQTFVRPVGQQLHFLVRMPLGAMNDIEWPEEERTGRLDLSRADRAMNDAAAMWILQKVEIYENNVRLTSPRVVEIRASQPSDRSFADYQQAIAHLTGPRLPANTEFIRPQGLLDVLVEYPIQSDRSDFSIRPEFERLGLKVVTTLRFMTAEGNDRAFEFHGNPGLVRLDPRWFQAAWRFVVSGFFHILGGIDHVLFLLCLVIPVRRFRALVPIVTAFTLAHSITLIASAYGMAPDVGWFPPLVETLIALSILYMAIENIVVSRMRRRWMMAFGFGLVHGFGFSFALRDSLQFAGSHLLTSLLSFNAGVEIGQLLVLLVCAPALVFLFRFVVDKRMGTIICSALIAHTGWHWMVERGAELMLYQFQWPVLGAAFLAFVLRWLMVVILVGGGGWVLFEIIKQPRRRDVEGPI